MLNLLSGRRHSVLSGLCLWRRPDDHRLVEVDVSILRMKPVTAELIEQYLDSGLWEGKAGGFGYQDGHDWLDLVQGSESNVVGLPLELLERMLQRF
jgi:septum formation protein